LTVEGDIIIDSGATLKINNNDSSDIYIKGDWLNGGTFEPENGDVRFVGDANQTIQGGTFNYLHIDKSNGIVSVTDDLNIADDLYVYEGEIELGVNSIYIQNDMRTGYNGIITAQASQIEIGGNIEINGSFNPGTSQVTLVSDLTTNIYEDTTFYDLVINKSASVDMVKCNDITTVQNSLYLLSGHFQISINGALYLLGPATSISDTLELKDGSIMALAAGHTCVIEESGLLVIEGDSLTYRSTITSMDGINRYALTINGTLRAKYFWIDLLSSEGITFGLNSQIECLQDGTFDNPAAPDGGFLDFSNIQNSSQFASSIIVNGVPRLEGLVFENSNGAVDPFNIKAGGSTTPIEVAHYSGAIGGEDYDDEVVDVITWISSVTTQWEGNQDNEWTNVENWDNGVPREGDLAIIQNVPTIPQLDVDSTIGNLQINTDAIMEITSGYIDFTVSGNIDIAGGAAKLEVTGTNFPNIYLYGDWSNDGAFVPGSSHVRLVGDANQNIQGSNFYYLDIDKEAPVQVVVAA